jgi:L-rhamnose mutarotase
LDISGTSLSYFNSRLAMATQRFAQIVKVKPECVDEYIKIHNPIPTPIADCIKRCNISDYSIFFDGQETLFAIFKYGGTNFEADMENMRQDEETLKCWQMTDALQKSFNEESTGSIDEKVPWWKALKEVFRQE